MDASRSRMPMNLQYGRRVEHRFMFCGWFSSIAPTDNGRLLTTVPGKIEGASYWAWGRAVHRRETLASPRMRTSMGVVGSTLSERTW